MQTYAGLTNAGLVRESDNGRVTIDVHLFRELMRAALERIPVDEAWYRRSNPDLEEALASGRLQDARAHYVRFGFYEHRMPYDIRVDEAWYFEAYPDIRAGVEAGAFMSGQEHFRLLGFREGRLPYANFSLVEPRTALAAA